MKHNSTDCNKFWRMGNRQSSLKHLDVNIQNIIIMLWVEDSHEMVHFIIINLFDWSCVCIWNILIVRFNWKIWGVKLNITIINGIMIKYPRDSWNHRNGFGRRGTGFEVICWRLDVPFYWCLIWLFTMNRAEPINIYSNTWWEEFRDTDDVGIILVFNPST